MVVTLITYAVGHGGFTLPTSPCKCPTLRNC